MVWVLLCISVYLIIFNGIISRQQTHIQQQARKINTMQRPSAAQIIPKCLQHYHTPIVQVDYSPLKRKRQNTFFVYENRIELNPDVHDSNDIVSIGIACHESGHAAFEYNHPKLTKGMRTSLNIISTLSTVCIIYGVFASILLAGHYGQIHFLLSLILAYFLLAICQMHKFVLEWNATRLALRYIRTKRLATTEEFKLAKQYLVCCFLTYVLATLALFTLPVSLLLL